MAGGGTTDVDFAQGCSYQGFGRSEGGEEGRGKKEDTPKVGGGSPWR